MPIYLTVVKNQLKNVVLVLSVSYIDVLGVIDRLKVGVRVCDKIELIFDHYPESLMIVQDS